MKLTQRTVDLILSFEVGSRASYERNWSRPAWPGGASGVTIGIGYDLGYCTRPKFFSDWRPQLNSSSLDLLAAVVGFKGHEAKMALPYVRQAQVPWNAAIIVFEDRSLPAYAAAAGRAFPGSSKLPPDCFGALVSLVYNRGASMTGDRRSEMREIRKAILAGKPNFVPNLIRSMKRLWVATSIERGMSRRREAEARLFEAGLESK